MAGSAVVLAELKSGEVPVIPSGDMEMICIVGLHCNTNISLSSPGLVSTDRWEGEEVVRSDQISANKI